MIENVQTKNYGATRQRGPTVSYEEIERTARDLMAKGERPTADGVRAALGRGSPNHIATCMQRFWKNQAAVTTGNPLALTHLPPELADAALAQWQKALLLAQQTAKHEDTEAREHLERLRREITQHARALELREKEWDLAARVRERALADAREHMNVLMKELASDRAELRARNSRIADLESQLEECRKQLASLITRAVARNRLLKAQKPRRRSRVERKSQAVAKKRAESKQTRRRTKK